MNYYKELTTGAVVKAPMMPAGAWWRVATEREYYNYCARIARAVGALERAVAYKKRVLGVSES